MPVLKMENIIKTYPKSGFRLQVNGFSLEEGSILGLLGANGAGKTTLIKLILAIVYPDSGTVAWSSNSSPGAEFIVRNVSYMPEYKNLYPNMSAGGMLKFSSSVIPGWNHHKAKKLLEVFPVEMGKKISTLSYGEKTCLYAIIAFAKDVPYIILDEPSRGLDPMVQERMLEQVKLSCQEGKTVLFSSHQLSEVEEAADIIAIIKDGQMILHDSLDDLKSSLFMVVVPPDMHWSPAPGPAYRILTRRRRGHQDMYLCQGDAWARNSFNESLEVYDVNLKDLFLAVNEGEEISL